MNQAAQKATVVVEMQYTWEAAQNWEGGTDALLRDMRKRLMDKKPIGGEVIGELHLYARPPLGIQERRGKLSWVVELP